MKSDEYWAQRMRLLEKALLDKGYAYTLNLEEQFSTATHSVERELAAWYQRFADNNEISWTEAKKLLTSGELKEFRWTVEEYIKYGRENALDGRWMKELENASARVHISRLDSLKLQLQQQAEMLYGNQLDGVDALVRGIYESGFYHTAFELQKGLGFGWGLAELNENLVTKVLARPWTADGQTFRDRCWTNKEALVRSVNTNLTQMIMRGDAPDKAIAAISREFGVSKRKAGRLVMTESAAFASAGQRDCFNALDVERYCIVETLDGETCELCGELDGKVFKMSEFEVGLTAPPFHPWCRGCTAPYFDDMDGERIARDKDGKSYKVPGDMTYKEWKKRNLDLLENQGVQSNTGHVIIRQKGDNMGIEIEIDQFTPCLLDTKTGKTVDTGYMPANPEELKNLQKNGWNFNWRDKSLKNSEVYKLTIDGDSEVQGLVAIEANMKDRAYHLTLAESAPHNIGAYKRFEGVGGHLFAIAVQKSNRAGYGGFVYFEAKNPELVKHYQGKFGAIWMHRPHEYSMIIDEDAAQSLLSAYTLD